MEASPRARLGRFEERSISQLGRIGAEIPWSMLGYMTSSYRPPSLAAKSSSPFWQKHPKRTENLVSTEFGLDTVRRDSTLWHVENKDLLLNDAKIKIPSIRRFEPNLQ